MQIFAKDTLDAALPLQRTQGGPGTKLDLGRIGPPTRLFRRQQRQ